MYASVEQNLFGQPHPSTHPHLFSSSHELTPGIAKEEYHQRRKKLMEALPDGSIAVLRAGQIKYMSKNIFYRFRQASDFWYLTGFEEDSAAVILEKNGSPVGYSMTLFCASKNPKKQMWDGPVTGPEGAMQNFGADMAFDIGHFNNQLSTIISSSSHVYTDLSSARLTTPKSRKSILNYLNPASSHFPSSAGSSHSHLGPVLSDFDSILSQYGTGKLKNLTKEVGKLRRIKSPAEKRIMKGAATRSARAHALTMQFAHPGLSEADLEAHFQYTCALSHDVNDGLGGSGCQRPAYVPVVASGKNALTIHHTANNQVIREGELVLLDGGGEWNGYASDITRTFPVSGRFTAPQRALYQAVLNVQKKCISMICTGSLMPSPGSSLTGGESSNLTIPALHRLSCQLLTEELNKLGFNLGSSRNVEEQLYPHLVGHGVGIDLHESDGWRNEELQAGQVITIEPGVYVPVDRRYPEEFHGIGIRIEDEVLIEEDHGVVLTVDAPKEVVDVEATCQGLVKIY